VGRHRSSVGGILRRAALNVYVPPQTLGDDGGPYIVPLGQFRYSCQFPGGVIGPLDNSVGCSLGWHDRAARLYPEDLIELRQGARVIEKSRP
jgi:hypothetical protein